MRSITFLILLSITISSFGQGLPKSSIRVISNKYHVSERDSILKTNIDTTIKSNHRGVNYSHFFNLTKNDVKYRDWFEVKYFSIYGGGALESLLSGDKEDSINETTSTTGSIAFGLATNRISCDILYSYNGREQISMNSLGQFGSTLMNPNLSGQSFSISVVTKLIENVGLFGSYQVADNVWQIDSITRIAAAPMVSRLGLCWNPFDFGDENENIKFVITANYTHRRILGDFNNGDRIIAGNQVHPRGYNGFDFSANLYLSDVRFIFQYSQNIDSKLALKNGTGEINIPGFSGAQVTFAVVVSGNIINLIQDK